MGQSSTHSDAQGSPQLADNPILVSKFVQGYGVYAKRVSYLPTDHDGITSWPIIDQPCYIVPASALTGLVTTDNQSQVEPLKSAPVQPTTIN